ncbi:hypothetical protein SeLEV6574_g01758 [Synchytrium endobioticum]|uniref:UFSP1/2/DUB catalytic domain-containing protein n=1 Tax=Synchytrium endobioticum TaxID=286115 RepID=A0A507DC20_9FUNG|nr:hypothetical protein SeLEV6574_g01758 [Synchytrium endobioticum]
MPLPAQDKNGARGCVECPVCSEPVSAATIQAHVDHHFADIDIDIDIDINPHARICPNDHCRLPVSDHDWDAHLMRHTLQTLQALDPQHLASSPSASSSTATPSIVPTSSATCGASSRGSTPSSTINHPQLDFLAMALSGAPNATLGVIQSLHRMLHISKQGPVKGHSPMASSHVYLAIPATPHLKTMPDTSGWGCGYLNIQMLCASILGHVEYGPHLAQELLERTGECLLPNIPTIQRLIEQGAWSKGIDPVGAAHFNYKLMGTRKWIGTSEAACLLIHLRCRVHVLEILRPDPDGSYSSMLDFVQRYFEGSDNPVRTTPCLPWQPRIEKVKSGKRHLLLFDPSRSLPEDLQNDCATFSDAQKVLATFRFDETKLSRNNRNCPESLSCIIMLFNCKFP